MIDLFKNAFCYIIEKTCTAQLHMLKYIPGVYDEAMREDPYMLKYIPYHLNTQEMCDTAVRMYSGCEEFRTTCGLLLPMPSILFFILDYLRTQGMCAKAVEKNPW